MGSRVSYFIILVIASKINWYYDALYKYFIKVGQNSEKIIEISLFLNINNFFLNLVGQYFFF